MEVWTMLKEGKDLLKIKEIIGRELKPEEFQLFEAKGYDYLMNDYFQIPENKRNTLKHLYKVISAYCSESKDKYLEELSYESCQEINSILEDIKSDMLNSKFDKKDLNNLEFNYNIDFNNPYFQYFEKFWNKRKETLSNFKDPTPLNSALNKNTEASNLLEIINNINFSDSNVFDFNLIDALIGTICSSLFPENPQIWYTPDMIKEEINRIKKQKEQIDKCYEKCLKNHEDKIEKESEIKAELENIKKSKGLFKCNDQRRTQPTCSK